MHFDRRSLLIALVITAVIFFVTYGVDKATKWQSADPAHVTQTLNTSPTPGLPQCASVPPEMIGPHRSAIYLNLPERVENGDLRAFISKIANAVAEFSALHRELKITGTVRVEWEVLRDVKGDPLCHRYLVVFNHEPWQLSAPAIVREAPPPETGP